MGNENGGPQLCSCYLLKPVTFLDSATERGLGDQLRQGLWRHYHRRRSERPDGTDENERDSSSSSSNNSFLSTFTS